MNYKKLGNILGKIIILEGLLMLAPLVTSLVYMESVKNVLAFLIPIVASVGVGALLQLPKPERNSLYQKEGFALVAIVWIVMALIGAVPFMLNGEIPRFEDAFFEIASGFTTTGSSVVTNLSALSHSTLFWRSFSHWIGGMGVLVFILIFIPESNEGSAMHLLRAESPGPQVGKIVSKMKVTTRILYLIYLTLTVMEVAVLMLDKPIVGHESDHFFISLLMTFGSAGTGGFGAIAGSVDLFNPFSQYVISIFLLLFGCNFTLYYLLLIGKAKSVFKSVELRAYVLIVVVAVLLVFLSLTGRFGAVQQIYTGEEAFRHSLFQVASILTTTGYSSTDFNAWPELAKFVLIILMFTGAMAGSTAGGIKTSRIVIAIKGLGINFRRLINPRYVPKTKIDGKVLEQKTISDVFAYVTLYVIILVTVTFFLSFDPVNGSSTIISSDAGVYGVQHGFMTNFTASLACISNIGPGFEAVGPYASYYGYSAFSKIILSLTMIAGRLEILPLLILFSPKTWKRT